jgi:hypothetical protein
MPRDEAIRQGEMVRDQAVAKCRPQLPTRHPAMLRYDLMGRRADEGKTLRDKKSGRFPVKKTEVLKLLLIAVLQAVALASSSRSGSGPRATHAGEPADFDQPAGPDGSPYLATIWSLILS